MQLDQGLEAGAVAAMVKTKNTVDQRAVVSEGTGRTQQHGIAAADTAASGAVRIKPANSRLGFHNRGCY